MISFRVPSEELSALLQSISKIIPTQDPNRLRTEFLFEIKEQRLLITGSSPEMRITGTLDLIEGEYTDCKFTVPPSDIVDYVKDLPEQPLTFKYEPDNSLKRGPLTMEFDGGRLQFTATDGDTYPIFEKETDTSLHEFAIEAQELQKGLQLVAASVSQDSSRRNISGVCFRFFADHLDLVATDSMILTKYTLNKQFLQELTNNDKKTFILPISCAKEIKAFAAKYTGEEIKASFSEKSILFKVGAIEIESLLIDYTYPNYESIIPSECQYELVMDTHTLSTVIKRMSKFINDDGVITLEPTVQGMKIKEEKREEQKYAEEFIALENNNNLTNALHFHKKRLLVCTDNVETDKIIFQILDVTRPIVIHPEIGEANYTLLNLISSAPSN